ncbi:MAG: hypothetical protein ABR498_03355 [Candidatus Dormibacteria bacterium]
MRHKRRGRVSAARSTQGLTLSDAHITSLMVNGAYDADTTPKFDMAVCSARGFVGGE